MVVFILYLLIFSALLFVSVHTYTSSQELLSGTGPQMNLLIAGLCVMGMLKSLYHIMTF